MSTTSQQLLVREGEELIFKEILASDLAYNYQAFAFNLAGNINAWNPSVLWEEMQWNPWLAMTVYRDLELKDDVIASALETRKDSVLSKDRRVLPASDLRRDKKVAEFVDETLNSNSFSRGSALDQILFETLDAVGKGVSIGEICFGNGGDRVYIADVKFKPQHMFSFSDGPLAMYSTPSYLGLQTGPLRLRQEIASVAGIGNEGLLPEFKFLVASYRPQYSNRWGTATLLKCFWLSWFKRQALKQWLRYLEKGPGSVVARYPDGASPDEKNKAVDAARAINEEPSAAIPNKFQIEVMEHVRQSLGTAFEGLTDDMCNNGLLRVILGQTLTSRGSEGGGSRALGSVHQTTKDEKTEWDAKFLMHVVNTYFVPIIVLFKFGPASRLPLWAIDYNPKRDLSADSIVHTRLAGAGLRIGTKFFYDTYQIPEPAEDEEVLALPANSSKPETPTTGVDAAADFEEKKTPKSGARLNKPFASKTGRFARLRPSMMESSSD